MQWIHAPKPQKGQKTQKYGLKEELLDQFPSACPYDLADSHLIGPLGRSGCRQIDEIDAGNDQNEERNC